MYGSLNQFGFGLGAFTGLILLTALNIYSKRVISRLHISRSGDRATIEFFSALWVPRTRTHRITEFGGAMLSYGNFTRSEITSLGNIWILKEASIFAQDPDIQFILEQVLNGQQVNLEQSDSDGRRPKSK